MSASCGYEFLGERCKKYLLQGMVARGKIKTSSIPLTLLAACVKSTKKAILLFQVIKWKHFVVDAIEECGTGCVKPRKNSKEVCLE